MPVSPLAPTTLPMRPLAASVTPLPTLPGTPDSISGDDRPLLTPEALAEALQIPANGEPVQFSPQVEAAMVEVFDGTNRLLGDVVHSLIDSMETPPPPEQRETASQTEARLAQHAHEVAEAREMMEVAERIVEGDTPSTTPGTPAHALSLDFQEALQAAEVAKGEPLTFGERLQVIVQTTGRMVGALVSNDPENGRGLRLLANGLHSVGRTGLIVIGATTLRELVGYAAERTMQLHGVDDSTRAILGTTGMLIGPVQVIAGGIREHLNHTDSGIALGSRFTMVATAAVTLGLLWGTGSLPQMASRSIQVLTYTAARDALQAFLPLQDNSRLEALSTVFGGLGWAGLQYVVGFPNVLLAPNTGAGHAMSHALNQTLANCTAMAAGNGTLGEAEQAAARYDIVCSFSDVLAAMAATVLPSVVRGVLNAGPEVADDHFRQHVSLRNAEEGLRLNAGVRVPTRAQALDTLLTTNAGRTTIFNNIVGQSVGIEAAIGHLLPTGEAGAHVRGLIDFGLCFWAYWPLILSHDRRAAERVDVDVEAGPDPAPAVETSGPRRRHMEVTAL